MVTKPNNHRKALSALDRAVLRQTEKAEQAGREGRGSILQYFGMMGALGWVFVTPPLLLGFLGRWLDRAFDTGFEVTALMLVAGMGFGGWLAWRRMHQEAGLDRPEKPRERKP
ncbi:MAG: AtpZ/AtpI family protein [Rhodospirillaceae bacterium]